MNVFEDLVVELKEENLLENTIIEGLSLNLDFGEPALGSEADFLRKEAELNDLRAKSSENVADDELAMPVVVPHAPVAELKRGSNRAAEVVDLQKQLSDLSAAYQMVEHILTAIERLNSRGTTAGFDDLRVSKAIHRLKNASADPASEEYAEAKKAVFEEVSTWEKGLTRRDAATSVPELRQYCETCQPALSSQALFSLARFYFERPATAEIRSKFDFVLTKLFTRPNDDGGRSLICSRSEIIEHLGSRFGEWRRPVGPLTEDGDALLEPPSCEVLTKEVEAAETLDELNSSNFFARVRQVKDSLGENFFTPSVAASVIDCNVAIGNKLVSLLQSESKRLGADQVQERYGFLERDSFETAANRTFDLGEVLRAAARKREAKKKKSVVVPAAIDHDLVEHRPEPAIASPVQESTEQQPRFSSFAVNKWLMIFSAVAIAVSVGLYFWADRMAEDAPVNKNVKVVELQDTPFKEFVKDGRLSSETLYGITTPAWDRLPEDQKRELLSKMVNAGTASGYRRVSLINSRGKTVGFGSENRLDITTP